MLIDKVPPEQLMGLDNRLPVRPLLHPTQRRLAGQGPVLSGGGLEGLVEPECFVIVQVFIARGNGVDPLADHRVELMQNLRWISWVIQRVCQSPGQPVAMIDFPEQKQSGIGGDVSAGEIGFDPATLEWRKGEFMR